MKRILIFAAYFHPHIGGYEKIVYELSRRLVQRDYEIDMLTCNTEKSLTYEERSENHPSTTPWGFVLLGAGLAISTRILSIYSVTKDLALGNVLDKILLGQAGLHSTFTTLMLQAMKEMIMGSLSHSAEKCRHVDAVGDHCLLVIANNL